MKPAITLLLAAITLPGCIVGETTQPLTYDQFVERHISMESDDTGIVYLHYDFDQPLASMEEVDQLYAAYRLANTTGEQVSESVVNRVNGKDDRWPKSLRTNLTYCVSDAFAGHKAAVVASMGAAAGDWQTAADGEIRFVYTPSEDANCTNANAAVTFNVIPVVIQSGLIARAFFPSTPRANRQLLINLPQAFATNPSFPLVGILRHELGHALGLRHETITEYAVDQFGDQCLENMFFREVFKVFDQESVMITPACLGSAAVLEFNPTLSLSFLDQAGIQKLY